MPLAAVSRHFGTTVLVLGLLLVAGALISGVARRSFVSLTALFLIAGFALGHGGFGVLELGARGGFVTDLATVALIVILFRDGLEVESEMLQTHWRLPLRKLVLAMPLTAVIIAAVGHWLAGLSWTEGLLLGALLSPTDPVLSSSVVTNPRVPRLVRHSLNLESGLNDGLALPAVLVFAAALGAGHVVWWRFALENIGFGFGLGIAVGLIAARLVPGRAGLAAGIPSHQRALFGLGAACAAYGLAGLVPHGNGLIAVFVTAITLGIKRPELRVYFERQAAVLVELVKLGIFVVFGSLLTLHGLVSPGWGAVAVVLATLLIARPVAVFSALAGTGVDTATRAFMSWFGPKGVATMTFSLLVLGDGLARSETIFHLTALTVVCSILLHGVTDHAGAEWLAARTERTAQAGAGDPDAAPEPGRGAVAQ